MSRSTDRPNGSGLNLRRRLAIYSLVPRFGNTHTSREKRPAQLRAGTSETQERLA
jgi:hypothetical protein